MEKTIVELGLLLDKDIEYYDKIMQKAGGENVFNCETHDLYWTNKKHSELEKMTENQIKKSCVRFRMVSKFGGTCFNGDFNMSFSFDNCKIFDTSVEDRFSCTMEEFKEIQKKIEDAGWYLIFDTFKVDYQYKIGDMQSRLQFQEIDRIGMVLYYDNPEYYDFTPERQKDALLDELNSYGFNFDKDVQGIDKLRTLLTGQNCYSDNQNG